jgi:hypothetical protein
VDSLVSDGTFGMLAVKEYMDIAQSGGLKNWHRRRWRPVQSVEWMPWNS